MDRLQAAVAVALLLVAASAVYIGMRMESVPELDPRAERQLSQDRLRRHAVVFRRYREAHDGAWPADLLSLRRFSKALPEAQRLRWFDAAVAGAGIYQYRRPPAAAAAETIVMAAPMAHAAAEWTDPASGATTRLPATHYVLRADLTVESIPPVEQERRVDWLDENDAPAAEEVHP